MGTQKGHPPKLPRNRALLTLSTNQCNHGRSNTLPLPSCTLTSVRRCLAAAGVRCQFLGAVLCNRCIHAATQQARFSTPQGCLGGGCGAGRCLPEVGLQLLCRAGLACWGDHSRAPHPACWPAAATPGPYTQAGSTTRPAAPRVITSAGMGMTGSVAPTPLRVRSVRSASRRSRR